MSGAGMEVSIVTADFEPALEVDIAVDDSFADMYQGCRLIWTCEECDE